ncbi:MAG: tetratricopeptide repeat protein [Polyangiaceae bacterium]|nr:tetratricopeptide repeat protein [Polyangiaceae bacterium]
MSVRKLRALPLAVAVLFGGVGCAEFSFSAAGRATLTYTEDARSAYFEALAAFKARNFEDARVLFSEVRKLFSYSRYARLAELRIADVDFEQGKFSDAVSGYRDFVQNHRSDPEVEYARYRISKSLFNDIEDSFILPPAEERDQATTAEAYRDLKNFLSEFPTSRYLPDAKYMHDVVLQRLVRHELYVARFYLAQEAFAATVSRIDHALKKYPNSGLDAEALLLMGETLLKMKKTPEARAVFERVIRDFDTPFAAAARGFLKEIGPEKASDGGATPSSKPAAPNAKDPKDAPKQPPGQAPEPGATPSTTAPPTDAPTPNSGQAP